MTASWTGRAATLNRARLPASPASCALPRTPPGLAILTVATGIFIAASVTRRDPADRAAGIVPSRA